MLPATSRAHKALARPVTRIDEDWQVRQSLGGRDDGQIERVAAVIGERSDAPFAENHLIVAAGQYVFRGHEPFFQRGAHATFEQHRLARLRYPLEEREVLHIAGANLNDVDCLLNRRGMIGVHQLGNDADARALTSLLEDFQALQSHALERVRTGPRLERAGPQVADAAFHQELGAFEYGRLVLDRARTSDDRKRLRTYAAVRQIEDGVGRVHFAAGELIGLGDADALLDAFQHFELPSVHRSRVASDADCRPRGSRHRMRRQAQSLDRFNCPSDLFRCGPGLHDDKHFNPRLVIARYSFILPAMGEEYGNSRDVDADLVEITSRLGEPDASYRTNPTSVAWRFTLGVLIVIAAAGLHYVMWSGLVPWPGRHIKLWFILLAAMFVGPGVGLYLINFAIRGRNLCVLAYPTGLFIWHRGRVVAFPWDEIRAIQIHGLPVKAILNRDPGSVWFDLQRSRRRVFGTTLTLTRTDGEQASLPSTLDDFPDLGRLVQSETYRRLFPTMWTDLRGGRAIEFGPIDCNHLGIANQKQILPWPEVADLSRTGDKLEVKRVGKKKPWTKFDFHDVHNPHVLMGIAHAARSPDPID